MGRPFERELSEFPTTYEFATTLDLDSLTRVVCELGNGPLIVVGSGGSQSGAVLAAHLHTLHTGQPGYAVTPLELVDALPIRSDAAVLLLSASGGNNDILAAFELAVRSEAREVVGLVTRARSRMEALSSRYGKSRVITYPALVRDGFLATNSLLLMSVALTRSYQFAGAAADGLPETLDSLLDGAGRHRSEIDEGFEQELAGKEFLTVLHGAALTAAATDVESKFVEAGLAAVMPSDYRNFAHGRHHWLAKHLETSGVVAFIDHRESRLARSTLRLVPAEVARVSIVVPGAASQAALAGMVSSAYITAAAGKDRGIDPGRPGVPGFGGKLYSLPALRGRVRRLPWADDRLQMAGLRKLAARGVLRPTEVEEETFRQLAANHLAALKSRLFASLVVDYDGTLCDSDHRFVPLGETVAAQLTRLLESGVMVGVATGRGKSVRESLRSSLRSELWSNVVVGYYNGAEIICLAEERLPNTQDNVDPRLEAIQERIQQRFGEGVKTTLRPSQLTVEAAGVLGLSRSFGEIHELLESDVAYDGLRAVTSTHSIDVLAETATKISVVRLLEHAASSGDVLALGDSGRWPGNDFELLGYEHSLSCDVVSSHPSTCWNLLPAGMSGCMGALAYLASFRTAGNGTFNVGDCGGNE